MGNVDAFVNHSDDDVSVSGCDVPGLLSFDVVAGCAHDAAYLLARILKSPQLRVARIDWSAVEINSVVRLGIQHIVAGPKRGDRFHGVAGLRAGEAQAFNQIGSCETIQVYRNLLARHCGLART